MGLEHIVFRHWYSSGVAGTSKFGRDIGLCELKELIQQAATSGVPWRTEGNSLVLEADLGRTIGTDATGRATCWLRLVVNRAGEVITAYPITPLGTDYGTP
jgi:hypothetical protein